jgi:glucosamine kinase
MNEIVLGVDAGGSKTRVLVATAAGEELANVTGAGCAVTPDSIDQCADAIAALVESALNSAEQTQYKPKVLYVGAAGAGREAEQVSLQAALADRSLAEEVVVTNDAEIALTDAFGVEGAGIVLIAGTGSIAYGRSPAGVVARCGGWGLAIGDEGSGAWLGRKALSVVASSADGREPPTALTGAVLTAAQVNDVDDLIPWSLTADRHTLAALAPSVMAVAMQDDLRANTIIDMAVEELMLHVRALAQQLFVDERAAVHVALTGGLLVKGSMIRKRLERRLKHAVPGAAVKADEVIGARGAVKLATHQLGAQA